MRETVRREANAVDPVLLRVQVWMRAPCRCQILRDWLLCGSLVAIHCIPAGTCQRQSLQEHKGLWQLVTALGP